MTETGTAFPAQKTAVVTGAGGPRGIGRALAGRLLDEGWHVAALDIAAEGVRQAEEELSGRGPIKGIAVDVTSEESVAEAFSVIDEELPPVVALANLAGIASPTPLLETSAADFQKVMEVNVTGSFYMLQAAGRRMAAQGVGRIVNTSSLTAYDGGGTFSKGVYAAAKAAVLGLTRGAARELGPSGITTNALVPGPVDTDIMGGTLTDERKAAMAADIPVGRVASPSEIAATVSFLFGEEAGFINGAAIQVDGGKHMR